MFLILHATSLDSNSSCTVEGWLGPKHGGGSNIDQIHTCRCTPVSVPVSEKACQKEWEGISSQCVGSYRAALTLAANSDLVLVTVL